MAHTCANCGQTAGIKHRLCLKAGRWEYDEYFCKELCADDLLQRNADKLELVEPERQDVAR